MSNGLVIDRNVAEESTCMCGSGKSFSTCCKYGDIGETPPELKRRIETCINLTLFYLGMEKAHMSLSIAKLVSALLSQNGIQSHVECGTAVWNGSQPIPGGKPRKHAWVRTQYGELCDLACDGSNNSSIQFGLETAVVRPSSCWAKKPSDRKYSASEPGSIKLPFHAVEYAVLQNRATAIMNDLMQV